MNTLVDTLEDLADTRPDEAPVCPACPPTVPSRPSDNTPYFYVRYCPDCGGRLFVMPSDSIVPCAGCDTVHAPGRFAASWGPRRPVRRGALQPPRTTSAWGMTAALLRSLVRLFSPLWAPNAPRFLGPFLATRGGV